MSIANNTDPSIVGVVLMTYGSATTASEVRPFLRSVYRSDPPPAMVEEFQRRFELIGHSPLVDITIAQAKALENLLNNSPASISHSYIVRVGMLHSAPSIETAITELHTSGASRVYGLLMSPQYSPIIMAGYDRALQTAAAQVGYVTDRVAMVGPWPDQPELIEYLSNQLMQHRTKLTMLYRSHIPVVFTTHSLPEAVVKRDPSYLDQLQATIDAIVARTGLTSDDWTSAYQSAGHSPEPWLKPDLTDILDQFNARSVSAVLVVPLQFLADHLEILYDLDIAAAEQATAADIAYHRIDLPNTDPLFIAGLAKLVIAATD